MNPLLSSDLENISHHYWARQTREGFTFHKKDKKKVNGIFHLVGGWIRKKVFSIEDFLRLEKRHK